MKITCYICFQLNCVPVWPKHLLSCWHLDLGSSFFTFPVTTYCLSDETKPVSSCNAVPPSSPEDVCCIADVPQFGHSQIQWPSAPQWGHVPGLKVHELAGVPPLAPRFLPACLAQPLFSLSILQTILKPTMGFFQLVVRQLEENRWDILVTSGLEYLKA